jgi:aminopeptidase-like protein
MNGEEIYKLAQRLWPIPRSITGDGVRETLNILREHIPNLIVKEVQSGDRVFDWVVPREWKIQNAYIITPSGEKICDFKKCNLHVIGYSMPIDKIVSLDELEEHLYSIPDQPDAVPYITSYYKERWGFCISHNERMTLVSGDYRVFIDSKLFTGSLTYGEMIVPGLSAEEVMLSSYICHPSMANNELSGPCVLTYLAKNLQKQNHLKYTYRIVLIPETIGSIIYLSKNLDHLKKHVVAGFNISCVGDERGYSYLPSRHGNTLSDKVAKHVLKNISPTWKCYSWSDRGSDERQYCAPGVDLPIASIMRTKYGEYSEYHTSLDDLNQVVTAKGLQGGYNAIWLAIQSLELNCYPRVNVLCEPQLGKRGLYPTLSTKSSTAQVRIMMDLLTWSDGTKDIIDIAEIIGCSAWELNTVLEQLVSVGVISKVCKL